jgi:hypothetical protein
VALFNRRPPAKPVRALTGAGARLDLSDPKPAMVRRREWQEAAWGYRDTVPELRFACRFVANSLTRLRLFAAENQPRGEDPLPLSRDGGTGSTISARTQQAAIDAIERLDLDARGSSLLGRLGENMEVAAEAYLLGEPDPDSPTGESWTVRSVTEIRVDNSGKVTLVEPGSTRSVQPRELKPGEVELLRVWNPHPQYYQWPDSELSALLDTCEELRLYDRLLRASGRSRISNGKLLFIPDELSLTRAGGAPVRSDLPGTDEDADPFMQELVAAMIEPIGSEDAPEAVVPLVLRGPAMLGDKPTMDLLGSVDIGRTETDDVLAKREAATIKFGRNINLPPEVLTGMGDSNHWSAWSIDANTVKNHIEPRAEIICDSLTVAYLRPMLREMGCPPDEVARICLWYDPSELIQNPNRGQDARDAHAAGVLSDMALSRTLGFAEEDMPSLPERIFRALEQRSISDQQVPVMLAAAGLAPDDPLMVAAVAAARAGVPQAAPKAGPQVIDSSPVPPAGPANPTPAKPTPISGSAGPRDRFQVRMSLCQDLAQVDTVLTTSLLAHADATVGRAVERAANRIRTRAIRDKDLAVQFRGRPAQEVVAELGKRALDYQDNADLDDATDALHQVWTANLTAAAGRVAELSGNLLGVPRDDRLTAKLTAGARDAWSWLDQQIRRVIQSVLYGGAPDDLPGEQQQGVVPASVIRGALAIAGGLPPASPGVADDGTIRGETGPIRGLATGDTASSWREERGAVDLGYEWQYYGLERNPVPGHRALSGRRFTSWTDEALEVRAGDQWIGTHYHPGDHHGCLCGFFPILATPMDPQEGRALADAAQLTESKGQREARILLAEADDAAGRTNTVAQQQRDARAELMRLRRTHIEERETP